ncbi:hypothetical protein WJX72_010666 [[Myrmecia] bisecta]|uniref:Uncharacterized protein n=1 Tax=[Myrmecia] bisecta TaxID=41462 RepID=A0AAW1Q5K7_9CHLO
MCDLNAQYQRKAYVTPSKKGLDNVISSGYTFTAIQGGDDRGSAIIVTGNPATGASGAGLQAVLANSVKEGLPCCLIVADFDGEVAAYRWKKGEADATETSKHVEAKGVVLLLQMNK